MEDLKKVIEERLSHLGIGAVTAAQRAGLERSYIRDFLKGRKRTFSSDKLKKLAAALGCDPQDLIGGARKAAAGKPVNPARQKWQRIFDEASPAEQQKMLDFLELWTAKNRKG